MVRSSQEIDRVNRLLRDCRTETLVKVFNDPLHSDNPIQVALNDEFQELLKQEIERRKGENKQPN